MISFASQVVCYSWAIDSLSVNTLVKSAGNGERDGNYVSTKCKWRSGIVLVKLSFFILEFSWAGTSFCVAVAVLFCAD